MISSQRMLKIKLSRKWNEKLTLTSLTIKIKKFSCNRENMAGHRHNKVRDIFAQVLSDVGAQVITEPAQFLDQGLKPDIEAHVVPGYDSYNF